MKQITVNETVLKVQTESASYAIDLSNYPARINATITNLLAVRIEPDGCIMTRSTFF
jgi:hypothetical protein